MALFGKGNIGKKVLAAIQQRITDGQAEFDRECSVEDERLAEGVRALTDANARNKAEAEARIVSSIIG